MKIAIIGAGIGGLTAAYQLKGEVVVFEKSRGFGGRAATRWYERPGGRIYVDHGAQYLKTENEIMRRLMLQELSTADLSDIGRPVWTFDADHIIREGDPEHNAAPKWSYRHGVSTLGKLLADSGHFEVRLRTRVGKLQLRAEGNYALYDTENALLGEYAQVLIAIPSGQAAELIAASELPQTEKIALQAALQAATYRRCLSITLGYERAVAPRPFYALLNSDKRDPLAWLGYEHAKIGHVLPGQSVLVAQMGESYSLDHWETPNEALVNEVAAHVSKLLGERLTDFDWADVQRWRYSQPNTLAEPSQLNGVLRGLWFVGDYLIGGRVHLAAESGARVAAAIREAWLNG
ncbi:MAG: FAD-dependent oxidoreductase [Candidatus Thermofonsia Clade 1 bacterium]|jgi:predicted NAD/FAD-dependent oxidoreductase|uniref:FAD-dependent oxidoreductase n=1 Tax=Candidatus Thermofonsia Clade 1 bacterium TaxID=2364210 RepID=A0A2M8PIY1_9CHLR|nr:MAG: FAD-dependent oxidoreductase [Candidatus Thermofonsia Clade 1 bacterium]